MGVRLSYNYRSEYFIDVDRARELYSDAVDTLDLSLNVNVTAYLALIGNVDVRPLGGGPGCLAMILISAALSILLTVLLNLLLR